MAAQRWELRRQERFDRFMCHGVARTKGTGVLTHCAQADRVRQSSKQEGKCLKRGADCAPPDTRWRRPASDNTVMMGWQAEKRNAELQKLGVGVKIVCVGKKATAYFKRRLDRFQVAGAAQCPGL